MRVVSSLIFGPILALSFFMQPARADVIQTFSIDGTYQLPVLGNPTAAFNAFATIDITIGTILSTTIFGGSPAIGGSVTQGYDSTAKSYFYAFTAAAPESVDLFFNKASLVGYAGGSLATVSNPTPGGAVSSLSSALVGNSLFVAGTVSPVPEPASIAIIAVGLVGTLAARRRPPRMPGKKDLEQIPFIPAHSRRR